MGRYIPRLRRHRSPYELACGACIRTFPFRACLVGVKHTVKSDVEAEYLFRVTTDKSSRVALSVSGQELFNDLLPLPTDSSATAEVAVERRSGSVVLNVGELSPVQLRYSVR